MLRQIDQDLWVAEQPQKFFGLEVGTKMTVIRLEQNNLLLISPVKITPELQQQLSALGIVKYLVVPNLFHYLYLDDCQKIFPQAETIAPPDFAKTQPNLQVDKVLTQDRIEFNSELEYVLFAGFQVLIIPKIRTANEIIFYHPSTKTLIITDSAFYFDSSFPLTTQLATRLLGSYQVLKPTWLEKVAINQPEILLQSINKILEWDFERIIMAHGQIIEDNAKAQLKTGYQWLVD